jgi:hypothetical protein
MADEIWKPIPGIEDFYEASSLGRIRSVVRTKTVLRNGKTVSRRIGGTIRKPCLNANGRHMVHLSCNGISITTSVHRLVCRAFHGEPGQGQIVAHFDGIPTNNVPGNLRWATYKQNYQDRYRHGTDLRGDKQYGAKLTWEKVREIRASTEPAKVLAKRYGVYWSTINKIWRNEKWVDPSYTR